LQNKNASFDENGNLTREGETVVNETIKNFYDSCATYFSLINQANKMRLRGQLFIYEDDLFFFLLSLRFV
jgi:hypothetical protein